MGTALNALQVLVQVSYVSSATGFDVGAALRLLEVIPLAPLVFARTPARRAHRLPLGPCAQRSACGTGQVRDRDRSRESARSANLRDRCAKLANCPRFALRAPKRAAESPQESRSRSARRGWGWVPIDDVRRYRAKPSIGVRRSRRSDRRIPRSLVALVCRCQSERSARPPRASPHWPPNSFGHTGSGPHRPR